MSITHVFLFFTLLTYTLGLYLPNKEVSALTDSEVEPSMKNEEKGLRVLMARHVINVRTSTEVPDSGVTIEKLTDNPVNLPNIPNLNTGGTYCALNPFKGKC